MSLILYWLVACIHICTPSSPEQTCVPVNCSSFRYYKEDVMNNCSVPIAKTSQHCRYSKNASNKSCQASIDSYRKPVDKCGRDRNNETATTEKFDYYCPMDGMGERINETKITFNDTWECEYLNKTDVLTNHSWPDGACISPFVMCYTQNPTPTDTTIRQGDSTIVVTVAVPTVSGCVLIVLIVCIIVCKRTRGSHKNDPVDTAVGYQNGPGDVDGGFPHAREDVSEDTADYSLPYQVQVQQHSTPCTNTNGVYDKLHTVRPATGANTCDEAHVYDHAIVNPDSTYDRLK
ncbi:hypothetical protein ScPMuIL_013084 [Solemya velum]